MRARSPGLDPASPEREPPKLRRAVSAGVLALVVATTALCAGCRDEQSPAPGTSQTGGAAPSLKLTLPPGWVAVSTSEQTLRAGPPGKPVLEIRVVAGEGSKLPNPEDLERSFGEALGGAQLRVLRREHSEDVSLIGLEVRGEHGKSALAFLGAKRVENDLYLCRSLPGASEQELQGAVAACKGITRKSTR